MQHKLINTGAYLLIVDESRIKEDAWYHYEGFVRKSKKPNLSDIIAANKIIAHLPLNNSPILEGVDLLPPLEDEVEKLAANNILSENGQLGFILGYNKAKEKYKYTEEDIIKAQIRVYERYADWNEEVAYDAKNQIEKLKQSLQQPKMPVAFLEKGAVNGTWVGEYIY